MPIARSAVLWGHVLTSVVANLVSLVLVVLVALAMGFRSSAGVAGWLAVLGILVLHAGPDLVGRHPGLTAKSVDGVSGFSYPLIFLPFISSASCQLPACPAQSVVRRAPARHLDRRTIRSLFAGQPVGNEGWIAVAWCVGLLVVAYVLAMRTYRSRIA